MDNFLRQKCTFTSLRLGMAETTQPFFCGDKDLDDFFHNDYIPFEEDLMGKSYCFVTNDSNKTIVAAFTVCNASIHNRLLSSGAKKQINKEIAEEKHNINYPAVLIGRLGVNKVMQDKHIGTELMQIIKQWFIAPDNKTGCRHLLVDAYNNDRTINYYLRNNFKFLISNLDSEKRYRRMESVEGELHTRLMYYDLIKTKQAND